MYFPFKIQNKSLKQLCLDFSTNKHQHFKSNYLRKLEVFYFLSYSQWEA